MIARAPATITVHRGALVYTRGTLTRGTKACVGYPLSLYVKPASRTTYLAVRRGLTDSTGSVHFAVQANETTRFQYTLRVSDTTRVHSAITELIVR